MKSMTGYALIKATIDGLPLSIEIKSYNSKYLEHKVKLKKDFIVDVPRIKIKLVHYFK